MHYGRQTSSARLCIEALVPIGVAGYCWNWPRAGRADTNVHEIKIGDFEIS